MNNENTIMWDDLFASVKACKNTVEFEKFSHIENCEKDIALLIKHTPNEGKFSQLIEAASLTKTRIQIYKKIKKREVNNDYSKLTEEIIIKERFSIMVNRNMENEYWTMYENQPINSPEVVKSVPATIDYSLLFTILGLFFSIYIVNFLISGKYLKSKLVGQLSYLGFDTYASLIKKSIDLDEVYDKKRAKKKGELFELNFDDALIVDRLMKIQPDIDLAFTLKKILVSSDRSQKGYIENNQKYEKLVAKIVSFIEK